MSRTLLYAPLRSVAAGTFLPASRLSHRNGQPSAIAVSTASGMRTSGAFSARRDLTESIPPGRGDDTDRPERDR